MVGEDVEVVDAVTVPDDEKDTKDEAVGRAVAVAHVVPDSAALAVKALAEAVKDEGGVSEAQLDTVAAEVTRVLNEVVGLADELADNSGDELSDSDPDGVGDIFAEELADEHVETDGETVEDRVRPALGVTDADIDPERERREEGELLLLPVLQRVAEREARVEGEAQAEGNDDADPVDDGEEDSEMV